MHSDRFIPLRSGLPYGQCPLISNLHSKSSSKTGSNSTAMNSTLSTKKNYFTWTKQHTKSASSLDNILTSDVDSVENIFNNNNILSKIHYSKTSNTSTKNKKVKQIKSCKIVDCPGIVDNFYSSPLDLSKRGYAAILLGTELCMFRQQDEHIIHFTGRRGHKDMTSVKFNSTEDILLTGQADGQIEVHDIQEVKSARVIKSHNLRVACLQIDHENPTILYSGSKDYSVVLHDLRDKKSEKIFLKSHTSEVCGLSLHNNFLASGSNDGTVKIWDLRKNVEIHSFEQHLSATKALSWCPWKNHTLVAGGGRNDPKIVVYNTDKMVVEKSLKMRYQISAIEWCSSTHELIYAYGKWNKGQIRTISWVENSQEPIKKMTGHKSRILAMKIDKNNDNHIASLSADECLRYWNLNSSSDKLEANEILNANFKIQ